MKKLVYIVTRGTQVLGAFNSMEDAKDLIVKLERPTTPRSRKFRYYEGFADEVVPGNKKMEPTFYIHETYLNSAPATVETDY